MNQEHFLWTNRLLKSLMKLHKIITIEIGE